MGGNKNEMVNTRRVRIKSSKTIKNGKRKITKTKKSIKAGNKHRSYTKSMNIQSHAYSSKTNKIRRPLKRSVGAMVLIAVRRVSGICGGTVCDILSELTAMRVQITMSLLDKVLKYFRLK